MRPLLLAALLTASVQAQEPLQDFPPPKQLAPADQAGLGIQRTMQLLRTSTPQKKNTVRILFYGQSITEQRWTKQVTDFLRTTYPDANLIIENRAIGGHSSDRLVKTAEADLYPFQPDLLIFHVYGAHDKYEDIIRTVREKTCAEVLIQTDHLSADHKIDEESDPAKLTMSQWSPWFNYVFLPGLAQKYDVDVIPQRDLWKQDPRDYDLKPQDLLRDGVHLNARGEYLMAQIVEDQLRLQPKVVPTAARRVTTTPVPAWTAEGDSQTLTYAFEGNRIDAIMANDGVSVPVDVLIDGQRPSAFPTTYAFTKVTGYNRTSWPCLLRVIPGTTPPVPEQWTITLSDADPDYTTFKFSLSGSVTGPDGEGDSATRFTSKSGRIVIDPADWNMEISKRIFKVPHPAEVPITFKVIPLHQDAFDAAPAPDRAIESVVTLAQNLPPGKHVLKLQAKGTTPPPVTALRAYNPQAK